MDEARVAAGAGLVALDVDRYIELDLDHWRLQMDQLREFFWSARLAQWAPFAGLLAVIRVRRGAIAALLGGWLAAFLLVKGFSTRADIQANTFWRLLMPAWPAYLILFAAIPLLVPTLARRLGDRLRPLEFRPLPFRWVVVAAILAVAIPTTAIAASSPSTRPERAVFQDDVGNFILTPIDDDVELDGERTSAGQRLSWTPGGPWLGDVFYRVYRIDEGPDVECEHTDGSRSVYCFVRSVPIATTRDTEYLDIDGLPERGTASASGRTGWTTTRRATSSRSAERTSRPSSCARTESANADPFVQIPEADAPHGSSLDQVFVGRETRSSSSAIRCASSTFSSVSLDNTVE